MANVLPPFPPAFFKAFNLTPERIQLVQEINNQIRKRTTYGVRREKLERTPASKLVWSNGEASWYPLPLPLVSRTPLAQRVRELCRRDPREALRLQVQLTPEDYTRAKPGDEVQLDANEIVAYGKRADIRAVVNWLEPLPLYGYSFEARERGIFDPAGWLRALFERWRAGESEEE